MSATTAQLQQSTIRQYTLQLRLPTIGGQFLKMRQPVNPLFAVR